MQMLHKLWQLSLPLAGPCSIIYCYYRFGGGGMEILLKVACASSHFLTLTTFTYAQMTGCLKSSVVPVCAILNHVSCCRYQSLPSPNSYPPALDNLSANSGTAFQGHWRENLPKEHVRSLQMRKHSFCLYKEDVTMLPNITWLWFQAAEWDRKQEKWNWQEHNSLVHLLSTGQVGLAQD